MKSTEYLRNLGVLLAIAGCLLGQAVHASVIITGTRVVYPAGSRDVNVKLTNLGETPALVQVWLDDGDANASPASVKVPFVLTPPVARIDPNKNQTLRLVYTGDAQSSNKEALYWLNMLEIPPKPVGDANYLQFAVRTRIKVFYRPAQLKGGPTEALPLLQWQLKREDNKVFAMVANPSPYYVSLSQVRLASKEGKDMGKPINTMLAPESTQRVDFEDVGDAQSALSAIRFQLINDFGAFVDGEKVLKGAEQ